MAAMDEQQPGGTEQGPGSSVTIRPGGPIPLSESDRKGMVVAGGLLAGLGLSLAMAFLMHVVQEVSPDGYAFNIDGSVLLEILIAGPLFGLGLAMALNALLPSAAPPAKPDASTNEHSPSS